MNIYYYPSSIIAFIHIFHYFYSLNRGQNSEVYVITGDCQCCSANGLLMTNVVLFVVWHMIYVILILLAWDKRNTFFIIFLYRYFRFFFSLSNDLTHNSKKSVIIHNMYHDLTTLVFLVNLISYSNIYLLCIISLKLISFVMSFFMSWRLND